MIGVGDKVVCVDDSEVRDGEDHLWTYPNGRVVKDQVYVIDSFILCNREEEGNVGCRIVGKPCFHRYWKDDCGYRLARFRKLSDHRNEQELEYRRKLTQPQPELVP